MARSRNSSTTGVVAEIKKATSESEAKDLSTKDQTLNFIPNGEICLGESATDMSPKM